MLVRLIYASHAVDTSEAAVREILANARQHNTDDGVTGILVHDGGVFLQAIEGARSAISALYASIVRDKRHRDVVLLDYEEIIERRFGGWTMGLVNAEHVNTSLLLKYFERPALDPCAVSGKAALALLEELVATASIIGHA